MRSRIKRIPHIDRPCPFVKPVNEFVIQTVLDEHAGAVRTNLARRIKIGDQRRIQRVLNVCVIENNDWRFAAKLQCQLLQVIGDLRHDLLASIYRTCERDFRHTLVADQSASGITSALNDIKHAGRQTRFVINLSQFECR